MFDLITRTTLRECPDELGYELRCPRECEAQIIDYAGVFAVAVDFETLKCPVKVIGADPTPIHSYLPTLGMRDILSVDYDFLPEATHFLQLDKPQEGAAAMRKFLGSIAIA